MKTLHTVMAVIELGTALACFGAALLHLGNGGAPDRRRSAAGARRVDRGARRRGRVACTGCRMLACAR
jgi:hypothetical protein